MKPHVPNTDNELTLLSTMIMKPEAAAAGLEGLALEDFHLEESRAIFSAIHAVNKKGLAIDLPTIGAELKTRQAKRSTLEIFADITKTPWTANYNHIIDELKTLTRKRKLRLSMEKNISLIDQPNVTPEQVLAELVQSFTTKHSTRSNVIRLDELMKKDFKEPEFIIPGILPEGLSLLVGKPKQGKSWLALDAAIAAAIGGFALGQKIQKLRTCYMALEDGEGRLFRRIRKQALPGEPVISENCFFKTQSKTGGDGIIELENFIKDEGLEFVIIDTYGRFLPAKDNNDYSEQTALTAAMKGICEKMKISILLVHHSKKNDTSDDFINHAVGSVGITGGVDSIIVLNRKRTQNDGILSVTGRDIEENEYAITFDTYNCRWSVTGAAAEVVESRERKDIIEVLKTAKEPMRVKEISQILGKNYGAVKYLLLKMNEQDQIHKTNRGEYMLNNTTFPSITTLPSFPSLATQEETDIFKGKGW